MPKYIVGLAVGDVSDSKGIGRKWVGIITVCLGLTSAATQNAKTWSPHYCTCHTARSTTDHLVSTQLLQSVLRLGTANSTALQMPEQSSLHRDPAAPGHSSVLCYWLPRMHLYLTAEKIQRIWVLYICLNDDVCTETRDNVVTPNVPNNTVLRTIYFFFLMFCTHLTNRQN